MSNDNKEKLKIVLSHWIAHNQDHSVEFKEWSEKAEAMGEKEVAADILQAIEQMEKSTGYFSQALEKLEKEG